MNSLQWLDSKTCARILNLQSVDALIALADRAPTEYREVEIRAGRKLRPLHIPNHQLKRAQRSLHRRVFRMLKPHPDAYAVRGRGTLAAARRHARHPWFFHTDLQNFYPSVAAATVSEALERLGAPAETARLLTRLVTLHDQLPQGAPTSPSVSELVLNPLDRRLSGFLRPTGLTYTRYADDVTISGGKKLKGRIVDLVKTFIRDEGWEINEKGGIFGPAERHEMLGLVVNSDPTTSPGYAERLRHFLRLARRQGTPLSTKAAERVAGRIEWVRATNPEKANRLQLLLEAAS